MVVRFQPENEEHTVVQERSEGELAEVIELRSWLSQHPVAAKAEHDTAVGSVQALKPEAVMPRLTQQTEAKLASDIVGDEESSHSSAYDDAVALLARKARTAGELRRDLMQMGHDVIDVDGVVFECESRLYLDDLGLARVSAERLREGKRLSKAQIRMKLRERLFDSTVIETVLAEIDDDSEEELLRDAAYARAHKLRGLEPTVAQRRLLGYLARRGWSGERATRIAREAIAASSEAE